MFGASPGFPEVVMTYDEARESACIGCSCTACCTSLQLFKLRPADLADLDYLLYLLNFDHIELGLFPSGEWHVYYRVPCRFLEPDSRMCTIHNQPQQPQLCIHYSPYGCWYRRVMTEEVSSEYLRLDRPRAEVLMSQVSFDDHRRISSMPAWDRLVEAFRELPVPLPDWRPQTESADEATREWEAMLRDPRQAMQRQPASFSFADLADHCSSCTALCCTHLMFPYVTPRTRGQLDFVQFALGYPGMEVGISDEGWSLIVRTRCRHLDGNRCGVFGQPERPLRCHYMDASQCQVRVQFGQPRTAGFLRLRLQQFPLLAECFTFDEAGTVTSMADTEGIRAHVERHWRRAFA
jgi:Fe-S-cluster containining protein